MELFNGSLKVLWVQGRGLDPGQKAGEGVDIHSNTGPARQHSLQVGCSTSHKRIQDQLPRLAVPLDDPAGQLREELGGILVDGMGVGALVAAYEQETPARRADVQINGDVALDAVRKGVLPV